MKGETGRKPVSEIEGKGTKGYISRWLGDLRAHLWITDSSLLFTLCERISEIIQGEIDV